MSQCLNPVTIIVDGQKMQVPCGRCSFCRKQKANDWATRLRLHFKSGLSVFVTLTYDDDNVPYVDSSGNFVKSSFFEFNYFQTVLKSDVQKFFKRLRKQGEKFSYYLVSEYGPRTLRPHYHFLANFPCRSESDLSVLQEVIFKAWSLGFVEVSQISENRIKYCTFYASKNAPYVKDYLEKCDYIVPPFTLMSKKMGLEFAEQNFDFIRTHNFLFTKNGIRIHTPRYFRKKVLEKLDENETKKMQSVYNAQQFIEDSEFELYSKFMHNSQRLAEPREHYKEHDSYFEFVKWRYETLEFNEQMVNNKLNKKSKF